MKQSVTLQPSSNLIEGDINKVIVKGEEYHRIVRCKDCKYSSDNGVYGCRIESFNYDFDSRMYANDFCGKAERRTDG